jgi:Uma2 family endonuclease
MTAALRTKDESASYTQFAPFHLLMRHEPMVFKSRATREQFHKFVLSLPDLRIERDRFGTVTIYPPMTLDSAQMKGEVFRRLANWAFEHKKFGIAYSPSASFDLPDGSEYKADGAWVSMEKINALSAAERKRIAALVPDFVIEVRSETDRISRLKKKMAEGWMANGVQLAWLIDPIKERVWVYRSGQAEPEEHANFDTVLSGGTLLPGFELDLRDLKQN